MSIQPLATQSPVRAPRSLQERDGETFCTPSTSKRLTDTTTSKRFGYSAKHRRLRLPIAYASIPN